MKNNYFFLFFLFISVLLNAQSLELEEHWWIPNGDVYTVVKDGNTVYLGGNFTLFGPSIPYGTSISTANGQPDLNFIKPNGVVRAVVPDGAGGWYIGGQFTAVGGEARNRIARINSDGSLHPWNPNANNAVLAIAVSGNTVYVGGDFTNIGGQTRNRVAAIDATTGLADSWNPNSNGTLTTIAVNGSTIYVGGAFTTIGGQTRNRIAQIDAATGLVTSWDPNTNGTIYTIHVNPTTVYAGGLFTSIGGQTRNRIAALDATTGLATAWNPNANSTVYAIDVSGTTVYAGGDFTTIGGQTRNRVAALDTTTGLATAWNPNPNSFVRSLVVNGTTVYAGGDFTTIGGQTRNRLAALDTTTGLATAWNPSTSGLVRALAINGTSIYAGGDFTTIGAGLTRNNIAALDATTGQLTPWNPNANNTVQSIVVNGATVYAGGLFISIGGQTRNRIAALNATTGLATAWNPNANNNVYSLAVNGTTLYAGGAFTTIGGQPRNYIAALDSATGLASSWNPNANNYIETIAINGGTVYAGGSFTTIGGQPRNYIAALDDTAGVATSWNPNANTYIKTIAVNGGTVYAGGFFTSIGGQPRNYIAALDDTAGLVTSWNPNASNVVTTIAVNGGTVYAGGTFSVIGGQTRNRLASLDATTGLATLSDPNLNNVVTAIAVNGGTVYAGGTFTGGISRRGFAVFNSCTITASAGPQTNVLCHGNTTGQATVNVTGGTGAYSYSWNTTPVQTTATASNLAAGTYIATVTDANNCTATQSFTITEPATAITATAGTQVDVLCHGAATGEATVNVTGGTAPYTYSWNTTPVQTTANATALAAGTYTVTVTDANLCTTTQAFTITELTALVATAGTQVDVLCQGAATGEATVNVTGGTAPYTYSWNTTPVQTTANATGLTIGTYTVTVTDANLCTTIQNFTIRDPYSSGTIYIQDFEGTFPWGMTVNAINGTSNVWFKRGSASGGNQAGGTGYFASADSDYVCSGSWDTVLVTPTLDFTGHTGVSLTFNSSFLDFVGAGEIWVDVSTNGGTAWTTEFHETNDMTTGPITVDLGDYDTMSNVLVRWRYSDNNDGCAWYWNIDDILIQTTGVLPLTVTAGPQTNVLCHGNATGTATPTVTGGIGTLAYSWDTTPAQTSATATGLVAGTYNVTVTDGNGCSKTQAFTITQPAAPLTATAGTQVNVLCFGNTTGQATVNVTGGTGAYSYSWNTTPVQTTATATNLAAGTYTVTITDANLCTTTQGFTITEPSAAMTLTPNTTQTDVLCNGQATGSATVAVTGGTGTYTYLWSNTQTTNTITGLTAGTYSVDVTDANGCILTQSYTITQPSALTASAGTQVDVLCFGNATGTATVNVTGGTGAYTYSWNTIPVQTAATATGLAAGTYNVTVTDANLCTTTQSFTITEPTLLTASAGTQTNVLCFGNTTGQATVNATGGTGAYSYSWNTTPVQTTATATGLAAGTYTVTVTDANLCTTTQGFTITQPAASLTATAGPQTDVLCFGNATGSATVNVTGGTGTYTYSWDTTPVQTTATATGLTAGTYTVTVTDANMCTTTQSFTITQPAAPLTLTPNTTQTNVLCNGQATGSATVAVTGGTGAYTYLWSNSQTSNTITGVTAGTYSVTVTDANGCTISNSFIITQPTALVATAGPQTNVLCFGNTTGQATVNGTGGTGAYTYSWNTIPVQTAATATNLAAGTYTVTVTDANLCTTTQSFTITQPSQALSITPNTSQVNVSCFGGTNGSATIAVNGGTGTYTYSWNTTPVQTNATATGLTAGTYSVTVTDANGCTLSNSFTITQPAALVATAGPQTNVSCFGAANGSAAVNVTGGTGAYSYSWNTTPVQTAATASGLAAGSYTVTITDANGCTTTQMFTITQPQQLTAGVNNFTNVLCFGAATGSATVTVAGGTSPYTYAWSNGQTAATATGLTAGTYTVTVTDANGCPINAGITITQPSALVATAGAQTNLLCFGNTNGSATVNVTGGTGTYTYIWNTTPVQTAATASGLTAGIYTVMVTDANLCTTTQSFTITQPQAVSGYFTVANSDCHATGSATVHAVGGTAPYTYLWSNGTATPNLLNALPGTYTVTITDANGCSNVLSTTINGTVPIVIISAPQSVLIDGGETAVFTVQAQNATTYQWQVSTDGGQTFTSLNSGGSMPGYYGVATATLTVVNAYYAISGYQYRVVLMQQNGCYILSDAAVLTVNPPVVGTPDIKRLEMTIYPNPASTDVFVKIPDFGLLGDITVAMYDLNGRIVRTEELITSENYRIDVTGLESAVYIISITSDAGRTDKKVTIKK
ncbi:T9SS type A sorting domain-containing protein [Flavobacterium hauense]